MTGAPIISVKGLSKAYRIWETPSSRLASPMYDTLGIIIPKSKLSNWLNTKAKSFYRDFWALRDVTFDIHKGESVGIIGKNGSGKSTLLQIIAGTLQATSGHSHIKGRIAALLELGSGFNGDFTGRENVYLNGAVLGLSEEDVDQKFDEIAAFADIGDFMDQPTKTYSSGMLVRLAFAVQTAVDPEILIIDEALSVGDEAFQRKCFARIEVLKKEGTTLLFVSHSAHQVIEICDRAILLSDGLITEQGLPKEVVNVYHQLIYGAKTPPSADVTSVDPAIEQQEGQWDTSVEHSTSSIDESNWININVQTALHEYEEVGAKICDPHILNQNDQKVNNLSRGHSYIYTFDIVISEKLHGVRFGGVIKTPSGVEIAGMTSHRDSERIKIVEPGTKISTRLHFKCDLLPGSYFMNAGVLAVDGSGIEYFAHRLVDTYMFKVIYEADLPVNALVSLLQRAEICDLNKPSSND